MNVRLREVDDDDDEAEDEIEDDSVEEFKTVTLIFLYHYVCYILVLEN